MSHAQDSGVTTSELDRLSDDYESAEIEFLVAVRDDADRSQRHQGMGCRHDGPWIQCCGVSPLGPGNRGPLTNQQREKKSSDLWADIAAACDTQLPLDRKSGAKKDLGWQSHHRV
jgi:hypothetical protein